MIFELCTDSYEGALLAKRYCAKRIELCSALSVGGLTPSMSLAKKCAQLNDLETHVMIRNSEGNFIYNSTDLKIMQQDIEKFARAGVNGVVFGCLTKENTIDLKATQQLVLCANKFNLEITFHRAFDFVKDRSKAIEALIEMSIHRVLSSGGQPTAMEGIKSIQQMVEQANGRIQIMAGSGINSSNAKALAEVKVDALHFTSHTFNTAKDSLKMGKRSLPYPSKIASIIQLFQ